MEERRAGKDRRERADRRQGKIKPWIMSISLIEKRSGLDQRSGLDRRGNLSAEYHHEALIEIAQKRMIKRWDSAKAKMTYLWDSGLKAITFSDFQKGKLVEVKVPFHQGILTLPGHVLRFQKVFTQRGFATEMEIQFETLNDHKRAVLNQIIWGD